LKSDKRNSLKEEDNTIYEDGIGQVERIARKHLSFSCHS
jgi:hypothetical protein